MLFDGNFYLETRALLDLQYMRGRGSKCMSVELLVVIIDSMCYPSTSC